MAPAVVFNTAFADALTGVVVCIPWPEGKNEYGRLAHTRTRRPLATIVLMAADGRQPNGSMGLLGRHAVRKSITRESEIPQLNLS